MKCDPVDWLIVSSVFLPHIPVDMDDSSFVKGEPWTCLKNCNYRWCSCRRLECHQQPSARSGEGSLFASICDTILVLVFEWWFQFFHLSYFHAYSVWKMFQLNPIHYYTSGSIGLTPPPGYQFLDIRNSKADEEVVRLLKFRKQTNSAWYYDPYESVWSILGKLERPQPRSPQMVLVV